MKKNKKYLMQVIDTDDENTFCEFQSININIIKNCANVDASDYFSTCQNPIKVLKADFDLEKILVDNKTLSKRNNDFQITTIYYDEENKPCMYKSIDRVGNISVHDISELEYTKNSIFGNNLNNMPKFVEYKTVKEAYPYLSDKMKNGNIKNMPVRLLRQYLIGVKDFKEGYHTITRVINGVEIDIHEYMLFNQTAIIKLIEYIPQSKKVYLTKQDPLINIYPIERTVGFLSSPIILLGNKFAMDRFCRIKNNINFSYYNDKVIKMITPLDFDSLNKLDKIIKGHCIVSKWALDYDNNISEDIYKIILPNDIFNLPQNFCQEMQNMPFYGQHSVKLKKTNLNIEVWIHTVSLFIFWPYYSFDLKKKISLLLRNYPELYTCALYNLVLDLGPRDALTVMKWTEKNLKDKLKKIIGNEIRDEEDNGVLFTFFQNNYDLPECLRIYTEETIKDYGGIDKLKKDFAEENQGKRDYIINTLECIAKNLQVNESSIQNYDRQNVSLMRVNKK